MIFGNIAHLDEYSFLDKMILQGLGYARDNDLSSLEKGRYEIYGDKLYFNVAQYTTAPEEERSYKAHKAYIDIHYMIEGTERIQVAFVSNMKKGEFQAEDDYLPVSGSAVASVILKEGDFLICYPEDGHCPGIQTEDPMPIKKTIFKVAI